MAQKETRIEKIARLTAQRYPYFGQLARKGDVDILGIVRFVLVKINETKRAKRQKIGNDARDISYTSGLLKPLSSKALGEIEHLGRGDTHRHLKEKTYPFSQLSKETREKLLHLPNSWIHEGALWQLNSRKPAILLLR